MNTPTPLIRRPTFLPLATAVILATSVGTTHAADRTWNGGGGVDTNWTTNANWGGTAPISTDNAILSNVANRTINVDGAQTINWLRVNNNGANAYTVGGNLLNITTNSAAGSSQALQLLGGNISFNNAVHFAGTTSASIDIQTTTQVNFNGAVTSAGDLTTVNRGASGSTMTVNGDMNINSGAGIFTFYTASSTLALTGNNSWSRLNMVANPGSTLQLGSDGALTAGSTLNLNVTSTLNIQAVDAARTYNVNTILNNHNGTESLRVQNFNGDHDLTFTGSTDLRRTQTIDVASTRVSFTGNWTAASGSEGLTKQGSGTLVIGSGGTTTVAYALGTTVNAGTLLVNGNMNNVSGTADVVTVNDGGTLGGTGFIVRETTVNSGGIIAVGDSAVNNGVGTLTFSSGGGNFIANDGAEFQFELNGTGTTHDHLVTNGGLNLGTSNTFTFDFNNLNQGSYSASTWATIWTNSSGWGTILNDNTFAFGTLGGGLSGGEFQVSGNDLQVRFAVIPEPSTSMALLFAGSVWFLLLRMRARNRAAQR